MKKEKKEKRKQSGRCMIGTCGIRKKKLGLREETNRKTCRG